MLSATYIENRWRSTGILIGISVVLRLRDYRRLPGYLVAIQAIGMVAATIDLWLNGKDELQGKITRLKEEAEGRGWQALDPDKRLEIERQALQLGLCPIYSRAGDLDHDYGIPPDLAYFGNLSDIQKATDVEQYLQHLPVLTDPAPLTVSPKRWVRHHFEVALLALICAGLATRWLRSPPT